ncbi:BRO family protein [Shewanella sp.]|uniref:BRO-N domain-containing protein n=1 Tax=Shewanella sp. TaxID=50422 RepID=UPI000EEE33A2|nr:BRO family protein [Shewanella sp.]
MRVIPDFKDGQPYFVAKDVAEALGFGRVDVANRICLARLVVKKAEVPTEKVETLFDSKTQPSVTLIPESDVCRLVMRSNLPSAQAFQDWVCGTVLPAIRKDGAYIMGEEKGINGK